MNLKFITLISLSISSLLLGNITDTYERKATLNGGDAHDLSGTVYIDSLPNGEVNLILSEIIQQKKPIFKLLFNQEY